MTLDDTNLANVMFGDPELVTKITIPGLIGDLILANFRRRTLLRPLAQLYISCIKVA
jgi:hypothetical protein